MVTHPLPQIEEASLAGGQSYSKLDLAHEALKELVTINIHRGLYQFNRLPFGVSSAPAIVQQAIEGVLEGLEHISVDLDDTLLTGEPRRSILSFWRRL